MHRRLEVLIIFFLVMLAVATYPMNSRAEGMNTINNVKLIYYSDNVKIYNITKNKIFFINNFSSFAEVNVEVSGNKVRVWFSPVPIDVFRNLTLRMLKNSLKINPSELENISNITSLNEKMYNKYLHNQSFVEEQYGYYLNNFTINLSEFVITYTITDNGYTVEEPKMGLFPFYVPYVIDLDTIKKYRPVYFGCPIDKKSFGYTYIQVPGSLMSRINKNNLEEGDQLRLVSISINCNKSIIIKKGLFTMLNYRGNYLFSSLKVILKSDDKLIYIDNLEPSPDTFVFLANIPVKYGPGNIGVAIVAGVIVVAGGFVYYLVRRRLS